MLPISLTGIGGVITLAEFALKWFGVDLPDGAVANAINGLIAFIGVAALIWGQVRRKDLKWGIVRK